MTRTTARRYHHGDLRRTLLATAVQVINEAGPGALSLRDLARRAGVSHAAPAHHFTDKAGLLTALAAEGYELLAEALAAALRADIDDHLLDVGVAYVRFAVDHRAHFEVMFRPDLYHRDDPQVAAARQRAGDALRAGIAAHSPADRATELAVWSIAHGFATLWLGGALSADPSGAPSTDPDGALAANPDGALGAGLGDDPEAAARSVIRLLFDPTR